jgi:hypothetical protein
VSGRRAGGCLLGRSAAIVALVVVLVGTGTSAGWALWTATADAPSRTVLGKVDLGLESSSPRAVDFTAPGQSVTTAITVFNGSTVPVDYRLTARAGTTGAVSADLAGRIDVRLWPATTASCTSAVPGDALAGTWAAAPAAEGSAPASARVTWCWRAAVASSAPDGATVNPQFEVVGGSHGWTDRARIEDFYQNTRYAAAAPVARALSCSTVDTGAGGSYVTVAWDAPMDSEQWGLFVAGQRVGNTVSGQAEAKKHDLTRVTLPRELFPDGRLTVEVRSVLQQDPGPVRWVGDVLVGPKDPSLPDSERKVSCA